MGMTLYQADLSPYAARVRIQLRAKGIEDEVKLELPPGGMSTDEYKAYSEARQAQFCKNPR